MKYLLLLPLLLAIPSEGATARPRLYHNATISGLATTPHTHVRVTGTVTLVRHEADGDIHFRVADDAGHFVVCEIIPLIPLVPPELNEVITVEGIHRYDKEANHNWEEIHPVEHWHR